MAAIFDGDTLLITLDAPSGGILNQATEQVYDDAKQWHLNANNRKYPFPFTTSGGEDVTDVQLAGQYYFIRNDKGWRIRSSDEDQEVRWTGNLIPFDLTLPIIVARAGRTVLHLGLQPLTTVIVSGSGLSVEQSGQLADVHGHVHREVHIDTEALINGSDGYQQEPFNNWTDAVDYAEANNLPHLFLENDATVDRQLKNFIINGSGFPALDLNDQNMDMSLVTGAAISGGHLGQLLAQDCGLSNVTPGEILGQRVGMAGTYGLRDAAFSVLSEVSILTPGVPLTIDFIAGAAGSTLELNNLSGDIIITNMDHADDLFHIHIFQGSITIDASCTAGDIVITGSAVMTDNSAGTTVDIAGLQDEIAFGRIMENAETFEEQVRLMRANAAGSIRRAGKVHRVRDAADSKDRITATADETDRDVTAIDGT